MTSTRAAVQDTANPLAQPHRRFGGSSGQLMKRLLIVLLVTLLTQLQPGARLIVYAQDRSAPKGVEKVIEPQGLTLPLAIDIALKTNPLMRATTSGRQLLAIYATERNRRAQQ
jgi:hypothetical protein